MAGDMGRMYVIGDRNTGVLFVKTDPLRAAIVPLQNIEAYANQSGITVDEAFARVARGAKSMIIRSDGQGVPAATAQVFETFFDLVNEGTVITDAAFCFIAEVENQDWSDRRYNCPPVGLALQTVGPENGAPLGNDLPEVALQDTM
jgi:hypothetical protein